MVRKIIVSLSYFVGLGNAFLQNGEARMAQSETATIEV